MCGLATLMCGLAALVPGVIVVDYQYRYHFQSFQYKYWISKQDGVWRCALVVPVD
jgi:hypothetical protein